MHKKVKFDWEELIVAFEDSGFDQSNYLDLETGEVVSVMREIMDSDGIDEIEQRVNSEPERYRIIPSIDSTEAYDDMVKFIDTVEDRHLAELLSVAISGKGAFRRFKDVLLSYPVERQRWFEFQSDLMVRRVEEWLQEIGIEPASKRPRRHTSRGDIDHDERDLRPPA
jgi:hypothetical protein